MYPHLTREVPTWCRQKPCLLSSFGNDIGIHFTAFLSLGAALHQKQCAQRGGNFRIQSIAYGTCARTDPDMDDIIQRCQNEICMSQVVFGGGGRLWHTASTRAARHAEPLRTVRDTPAMELVGVVKYLSPHIQWVATCELSGGRGYIPFSSHPGLTVDGARDH